MTSPALAPADSLFKIPEPGSVWSRLVFDPTYDPIDVLQTALNVKTKSAKVVPFNPFRTQRLYFERMGLRNVIVKPRQVGMSTGNLGILSILAATTPNLNTLVVTHREDATSSFRQTIKDNIAWLNEITGWNNQIGVDNENQLEIKTQDSSFFFGSSRAPGIGRSRTIQMMLASEVAHWEGENPGQELAGMTESIPDRGLIIIESTPNGAAGPFYETYKASGGGYVKHFFPWFIEPSRRLPLYGKELHLTPEEQLLVTMHSLDHEQIAWRRWKWEDLASKGLYFLQEYPEDDETCFMAGLKSVFPAQRMVELMTIAQHSNHATYDVPGDPWDPGGELTVWQEPKPGFSYIATGDVGGGHRDGDLSVLIIRDVRTGDHVATLAGHWTPTRFADESVKLAVRYNTAYLSHESTGLGMETVNRCVNIHKYPNYHYEQRGSEKGTGGQQEWQPGFNVSPTSRARMLGALVNEVSDQLFRSRDLNVLRQMTAARLERMRTAGGWADRIDLPKHVHDDHVMAYAQSCLLMEIPQTTSARRDAPAYG